MLVKLFSLSKVLFLSIITAVALSTAAHAFTNLDSEKTTIEDEVGKDKWTVVEVWASHCGACLSHMPEMVKFDGTMKDVRILGISTDGQAGKQEAKDVIKKFDVSFRNILSNSIEVNAWMELNAGERFRGTPTFMIFNPKGVLTAVQPGVLKTSSLKKYILDNS